MGRFACIFFFALVLSNLLVKLQADDAAALHEFLSNADPAGSLSIWDPARNGGQQDYCKWQGVLSCDAHNRVLALALDGIGLNGTIDSRLFSNLDQLRIISLQNNKLHGTIPDFSGAKSLHKILLDHNILSGPIPPSLGVLSQLKSVSLSDNHLTGNIPDSPYFAQLASFDVSDNNLTGKIPDSLSSQNPSAFQGNRYLCGHPLDIECSQTSHHGLSIMIVICFVLGITIGAIVIVVGLLWFRHQKGEELTMSPKKKNGSQGTKSTSSSPGSYKKNSIQSGNAAALTFESFIEVPKDETTGKGELVLTNETEISFELQDLLKATAEILGRGVFGTTYRASLDGGLDLVVKRMRAMNNCGKSKFVENLEAIGRIRHPNILPLRAYFYGKEEKLMVYDYQQSGSLFNVLHALGETRKVELDWVTRIQVARGVASALEHIHQGSSNQNNHSQERFHGNVKSSNVLLGPNNEALLADYGMAPLVSNTPLDTYMAGRRAPECRQQSNKRMTQSVDIYSYGVLLLELLTGKLPLQSPGNNVGGVDLPHWVESVVKEEWTAEVFDREISFNKVEEDELVALLKLAMSCVSPMVEQRPSMSSILQTIREEVKSLDDDDADDASVQFYRGHTTIHIPSEYSFSLDDQVSRLSSASAMEL